MELNCDTCDEAFTARRGARYCSGKCRTVAYRRRNGELREPARRRPLPDAFWDRAYDVERKIESLERLADDDRFERNSQIVALRHRNDLIRAAEALQRVIDRLPEPSRTIAL